jgi:hypothetical protein
MDMICSCLLPLACHKQNFAPCGLNTFLSAEWTFGLSPLAHLLLRKHRIFKFEPRLWLKYLKKQCIQLHYGETGLLCSTSNEPGRVRIAKNPCKALGP